jgi:sec-independent protein translocase protein TatC
MGLLEHLAELRRRVFAALLALVAGTVVGFFVAEPILAYLQQPYGREFVVLGPTSGISAYFRVALLTGGILAMPIITYQIMMFVLPGLTRREKRLVVGSLPPIALLFITGTAFTWFLLIPPAIGFLEGFQPTLFQPEWTADLYLGFVTTLLFWMGVAFETPLVFLIVALLGFLRARALIRNWRIAIVGAMVAAAIITPTVDPVNMVLVVVPLLGLYALSIALVLLGSTIHDRRALPEAS